MGETPDGSDEADGGRIDSSRVDPGGVDRRTAVPGRSVRVSYEPRGFGVALVVGDGDPSDGSAEGDAESETGVLRVSDAVVTLEIPLAGGGHSVLSWDPAEVAVDPQVA